MTAHDPRVTLTEAEKALLDDKCPSNEETGGWEFALLHRTVEGIIAARLAPIRALAERLRDTRESMPPEAGQGRAALDIAEMWLRRALDAPVSASQDHDGAEGQGEAPWSRQRVHIHPPYEPTCNERRVDGQLRGACLNDDGSPR